MDSSLCVFLLKVYTIMMLYTSYIVRSLASDTSKRQTYQET